ncbi:Bifunctional protein HldE [Rubripirellula tenax]|uniref:Bifunctional protein HldE n=1 Tax=Rubripirellula tenax TaxID=2528015 RepID=A0A5C6F1Y7_9BACT|nr:carbohydrate kinase [Rubripirellula tenax]TWU54397.1 Bifunctional protein HldE [Rubripirellula tenax]
MTEIQQTLPPLIAGEVLFDHFPDGQRILGGAPMNVAWNLQGLGLPPVFLSAIGNDDDGKQIRDSMFSWGMDTRGLQQNDRPTGRVAVTIVDGQPQYEIVENVAFDFISRPDFQVNPSEFSILAYGSLACRSHQSRETITDLIRQSSLRRFVDINIRDPFFDAKWLSTLIGDATWVKLSEDELSRLVDEPCQHESQIYEASNTLRKRFGINTVLVTCGSKGAYGIGPDGQTHAPVQPLEKIADTVGAGDAFASATIAGLVHSRPLAEILPNAVKFASRVCGLTGATTSDIRFYQNE